MVAELYEIDITKLRKIISEDAVSLKALWHNLLPSVLLLLFNQKLLQTPQFIAEKPWREVAKLAMKFAELKVMDEGEKFSLPAGGFLLQGKVKQKIKKAQAILSREEQAKEAVKKELKRKMKNVNINVALGLFNTEQGSLKEEVPKV